MVQRWCFWGWLLGDVIVRTNISQENVLTTIMAKYQFTASSLK